ncbi:hypothetical protein EG329_005450 [Mollisiaceae sp. DMI_Dod_QoI]|nr:hypothetical protein EG329_005450 [Helotiales sp. DMI_Dod_QoI]
MAKGIIPISLTYPAILGHHVTGYVHSVGDGVARFKKGDRVYTMSAVALRNDHRFGGHQRYTLSGQTLTAHIGNTPFEEAASASALYAAMSALTIYLKLDRPSKNPDPENKDKKVLIWGGGSTLGFFAIQIASQAGYTVITTASPSHSEALLQVGATQVVSYHLSPSTLLNNLLSHGPYTAVLDASSSPSSQTTISEILSAQGGGTFLSTMGVNSSITLPKNVKGVFVQYADDYLKPEMEDYARWVFWEFLEEGFRDGKLTMGEVEVIGGLDVLGDGLGRLQRGEVRGRKLVVKPNLELHTH